MVQDLATLSEIRVSCTSATVAPFFLHLRSEDQPWVQAALSAELGTSTPYYTQWAVPGPLVGLLEKSAAVNE